MPYKDADKRRDYNRRYQKRYYKQNKAKRKAEVRERRKSLRRWYADYRRGLSCQRCGLAGDNCPWLLEFHHRPEEDKLASVSFLVNNGYSIARVEEEMEKCVVFCANCDRREHYEESLEQGSRFVATGGRKTIDLNSPDIMAHNVRRRRKKHEKERRKVREIRKGQIPEGHSLPGPNIDEEE